MKIRTMTRVALFAALTAVGAFFPPPLGYSSLMLPTFFPPLAGRVVPPRGARPLPRGWGGAGRCWPPALVSSVGR